MPPLDHASFAPPWRDPPGFPASGGSGNAVPRIIHAALPGRVRLHLAVLRRAAGLKATLESALASLPTIRQVHASTDTGNLLVLFDPGVPVGRIVAAVAALARGEPVGVGAGLASARDRRNADWHLRPVDEVARDLGSSAAVGLPTSEARRRLGDYGSNRLPSPAPRAGMAIFLDQFRTLPVGLLALAGAFSLLTGALLECAAIAGVVALNGALGFAVESRSERTIRGLEMPGQDAARVIRDGIAIEIAPEALVPGDLLVLGRGDMVPADARLVSARDLTVGEAMLTGESRPVAKTVAMPEGMGLESGTPQGRAPEGGALPLGERTNMVYRGTAVSGGSALALVVATGARTEIGRIQRLALLAATPETPMQRHLDAMGRQLLWLSAAVCGLVFGVGVLRGFGLAQMLRSSAALAVAAIPEGLPTVATTALSIGIEDMRRQDVLVRRVDAVETLASVGVICFDKTGTLTMNSMSVASLSRGGRRCAVGPGGEARDGDGMPVDLAADPCLARLLRIGALCSETDLDEAAGNGPELNGSATENALVRLALQAGVDPAAVRAAHPRLSMRLRTETDRFMATTHRAPDGRVLVAVKGSPEAVLECCDRILDGEAPRPMTAADRAAIGRANAAMAEAALRVLGFAYAERADDDARHDAVPDALVWVGLAGLEDPVRPGMPRLIDTLHGAGLRTVMMTGDQVATARAVARRLRLAGHGGIEVLDAAHLDRLPPERLVEAARRAHVFARVSPAQKLRIVRALQRAGNMVAMAGDGINDSPALKAADVGIAMGHGGTTAAREVADIVLQTDDLMALALAVERGRGTRVNVRKAVRYLLGTNLSEIAVMLVLTACGVGDPLTALQLLWINLISDILPGLGLAFEIPAPELMRRPPPGAETAMLRGEDMRAMAAEGSLLAAGALAACFWGVLRHGAGPRARTMTFGSLVLAQLLHALTCRRERGAAGGALPANPKLRGALAVSFAAQAAALLTPGVRRALGVVPIGPIDTAVMLGAGTLPYLLHAAQHAGRSADATRAAP